MRKEEQLKLIGEIENLLTRLEYDDLLNHSGFLPIWNNLRVIEKDVEKKKK